MTYSVNEHVANFPYGRGILILVGQPAKVVERYTRLSQKQLLNSVEVQILSLVPSCIVLMVARQTLNLLGGSPNLPT